MKRRALLGGVAATLSTAAHAQPKAMPVIGFLGTSSPTPNASFIFQLRRGLAEGGYEEGKTVAVDYRWAEGRYDRLATLATELVARKVDVIVSQGGSTPAVDAMKATRTIPIVFITGGDPVADGLVTNLARPTANATGVTWISSNLGPKRLELLRASCRRTENRSRCWPIPMLSRANASFARDRRPLEQAASICTS